MKLFNILLVPVLLCLPAISYCDVTKNISGSVSGWLKSSGDAMDETHTGVIYIPEVYFSHELDKRSKLDVSVAGFITGESQINKPWDFYDDSTAKIYRSWARYTLPQLEVRAGRQKINFGPAKILRALKWFDRLDIRDPLQITDGVDALLVRYYFPDNANAWLWILYGNGGLKGLETYGTDKSRPELGGRYQMPVPGGEAAVSFHRRSVENGSWNAANSSVMSDGLQQRVAVDGNWDAGIGVWFEASAEETAVNGQQTWRQSLATAGADYTFDSGIHLTAEHFIRSADNAAGGGSSTVSFSALSADKMLSLLDSVNIMGYYHRAEHRIYPFALWQRRYDNWQYDMIVFSAGAGTGAFAGRGFQCTVSYSY